MIKNNDDEKKKTQGSKISFEKLKKNVIKENKIPTETIETLFTDGFNMIEYTLTIHKEIVEALNNARRGTLEGISRQTVSEHNITSNENDIGMATILMQKYSERDAMNRYKGYKGGKKTNKKSRKTNKKSRKNKYKY